MPIPHATYNFVPLADWVYQPPWGSLVSHDIPFTDGLCGEIDISITAETPILVGGARKIEEATWTDAEGERGRGAINHVYPFRVGDRYAIPPATLQGAIRGVMEIASFAKFERVEDTRFGIRDLTGAVPEFYGDRLNSTRGRAPAQVTPNVRPGLLRFSDGRWEIVRCDSARISFGDLAAVTKTNATDLLAKEDVPARYARIAGKQHLRMAVLNSAWHQHQRRRWDRVTGEAVPQDNRNRWVDIRYSRAVQISAAPASAVPKAGLIVLTGKPQDTRIAGHPGHKKQEFFFFDFDFSGPAVPVPAAVMQGFITIHEPDDGRPQSPNWQYWKDPSHQVSFSPSPGHRYVPVFYLEKAGVVEAFGLAYRFKLPHSAGTHDLIRNSSPKHLDAATWDLPSLIFGLAADDGEAGNRGTGRGLKGRVAFDFALAEGNPQPLARRITPMTGPKPSYYPFYVRQAPQNAQGNVPYTSYTPLPAGIPERRKPTLAGWKRYPVHTPGTEWQQMPIPNPPPRAQAKQLTALVPLPAGTSFKTKLRFHNLRPVELGALIWAIRFGQANGPHRHANGMGKPFGLGQVRLEITAVRGSFNRIDRANPGASNFAHVPANATDNERAAVS